MEGSKVCIRSKSVSIDQILGEDVVSGILSTYVTDRHDKLACRFVCKRWMQIMDSSETSLRLPMASVVPLAVERFKSVEDIDCSKCHQLLDCHLRAIAESVGSQIKNLNLSKNKLLTNEGMGVLLLFTKLERLTLSLCRIGDVGILNIARCKSLKYLNLDNCRDVTDKGMILLAGSLHDLEDLNLKWCVSLSDLTFIVLSQIFPHLTSLDLSSTSVTSRSFLSLSQAQNLRHLALCRCEFVDNSCLYTMQTGFPALLSLDLTWCLNFDSEALSRLLLSRPQMELLNLTSCTQLRFEDPASSVIEALCSLQNLRSLKLADCQLTEQALLQLQGFGNALQELSFRRCSEIKDPGVQTALTACSALQNLDLTCCRNLTDGVLLLVSQVCRKLRALKIEGCKKITSAGFRALSRGCLEITELDATEASVDDDGMAAISGMKDLQSLKVGFCTFTDVGMQSVAKNCRKLSFLDVYNCESLGPAGIESVLRNCRELTEINLSYTRVTDETMSRFEACPKLKNVEVRGAHLLSCQGVSELARRCPNVLDLDFKHCLNVGDGGMLAIAKFCPKLRQVNVSYTQITGVGLRAICGMPCMGNLKVVHCKNVTAVGFGEALLACTGLKKVKLLERLRVHIAAEVVNVLEDRGCFIRWIEKPDPV